MLLPFPKKRVPAEIPALHTRADDNLRFIRQTMEKAASFTAVPGWGGVFMGLTALFAAAAAAFQPTMEAWLTIWIGEALVAFVIGIVEIARKIRNAGPPFINTPLRKFSLSLIPALLVGALLTAVLYRQGEVLLLPGIWMLLYGTAVVTGGAFSVKPVPIMGACFLALGTVALFSSFPVSNGLLALGFGGLHIGFGLMIAKQYGG